MTVDKPVSNPDKLSRLTLESQRCDGVTMMLCRELDVVSYGKDPDQVKKNVFDSIIANAAIVLRKRELNEDLTLVEEKRLIEWASIIKYTLEKTGDISSLFEFRIL